jgi:hypothetical protein
MFMGLDLHFRYDREQDRINLVIADPAFDPQPTLWLTRALVGKLLTAVSQFAGHAAPKLERSPLPVRHEMATTAPRPTSNHISKPASPFVVDVVDIDAPARSASSETLVTEVKLGRRGEAIFLSVTRPGDKPLTLPLTDADLLRFLDVLYRKSVEAGWRLEDTVPWLKSSYFGAVAAERQRALN